MNTFGNFQDSMKSFQGMKTSPLFSGMIKYDEHNVAEEFFESGEVNEKTISE